MRWRTALESKPKPWETLLGASPVRMAALPGGVRLACGVVLGMGLREVLPGLGGELDFLACALPSWMGNPGRWAI